MKADTISHIKEGLVINAWYVREVLKEVCGDWALLSMTFHYPLQSFWFTCHMAGTFIFVSTVVGPGIPMHSCIAYVLYTHVNKYFQSTCPQCKLHIYNLNVVSSLDNKNSHNYGIAFNGF